MQEVLNQLMFKPCSYVPVATTMIPVNALLKESWAATQQLLETVYVIGVSYQEHVYHSCMGCFFNLVHFLFYKFNLSTV